MVEQWAERIAWKIKENSGDENVNVDVMKFALTGILHNTITIAFSLLVGLIFGKFTEVFLTVFSFMLLRLFSGGYHFKSPLSCFLFSATVFIAVPFIPMPSEYLPIINTISLALCLIFSPSNIKAHIRISEKYFIFFKLLSIMIVGLAYLLNDPVITLSLWAQSMTLITFKR